MHLFHFAFKNLFYCCMQETNKNEIVQARNSVYIICRKKMIKLFKPVVFFEYKIIEL